MTGGLKDGETDEVQYGSPTAGAVYSLMFLADMEGFVLPGS